MSDATVLTPNPNSTILKHAIIASVGIGAEEGDSDLPAGYGTLVLYVPLDELVGKDIQQLQDDIGLPWRCTDSKAPGIWIRELMAKGEDFERD